MSAQNNKGWSTPPPQSKEEWIPFAEVRARPGGEALNHSGGAPVYGTQPEGWKHDSVAHERAAAKGGPEYAATRTHSTASGSKQETPCGTQALDAIGST